VVIIFVIGATVSFHRCAVDICALLGFCVASVGSHYQPTPHRMPEKRTRISFLQYVRK